MKGNKFIVFVASTLSLVACKPNFDDAETSKGQIDPTTYVAIGGSVTAGYSNGALYYDAQQNAFANLLAEQLKQVGGGDFKTPFVSQSSIGMGNANNAPSILGNRTDCQGTVSLGPVKVAPQGDASVFTSNIFASQGSFNNFGVPDLKITDVDVNGYSNPFYQRFSSNASSSILSDAQAKNPTFFTVMLGLHDVLNYALKGGTADSITPSASFDASLNNMVNKLTANGAKGAIANIPSIKTLAYFNTIAYNALKLDSTSAANLNLFYSALGSPFVMVEGNNGFVIEDNSQFLGFRQAKQGEYILLNVPLDSVKCFKWGSLVPIPNRYVLDSIEVAKIEQAIVNYNTSINSIAVNKNLAFVDVNAFFGKIKAGFVYNGITINANFVSGGAFSLDGLNLTHRGNALLANEFIKSINSHYQASIPQLDATKYPAVVFPQ